MFNVTDTLRRWRTSRQIARQIATPLNLAIEAGDPDHDAQLFYRTNVKSGGVYAEYLPNSDKAKVTITPKDSSVFTIQGSLAWKIFEILQVRAGKASPTAETKWFARGARAFTKEVFAYLKKDGNDVAFQSVAPKFADYEAWLGKLPELGVAVLIKIESNKMGQKFETVAFFGIDQNPAMDKPLYAMANWDNWGITAPLFIGNVSALTKGLRLVDPPV